MGVTVKIEADKVARALDQRNTAAGRAILRGLKRGAQRGRLILVRRTPRDRGTLAAAWDVEASKKLPTGRGTFEAVAIFNDAPYVSVVERGTRAPYHISRKGIENLVRWAKRKFGYSEEDARNVAWGIAKRYATKRRKGTYFVRDSVEEIGDAAMKEVMREIGKLSRERNPR